jgi:hypothetical protein
VTIARERDTDTYILVISQGSQPRVYGDEELVHAPVALYAVAAVHAVVEHHGDHPPGDEAALLPRPAQHLAAAGGLPAAAPGHAHRPRLLLVLVLGDGGAGPRLLELPHAEEIDVAVLRGVLEPLCAGMAGRNAGSDVRRREREREREIRGEEEGADRRAPRGGSRGF